MDLKHVRNQFPAFALEKDGYAPVFLDGPGGGQVSHNVLDAMISSLATCNANLGGVAFPQTLEIIEHARAACAALINAPRSEEIFFGPTMTSNTLTFSRALSRNWQAGDEIIVTALDHYANVSPWIEAAKDKGVTVHQVQVKEDDCSLDMEDLAAKLSDKTKLVAFTAASNVTGTVVDVKAIVAMAKSVGALTYIDAVHYTPHFLPDVQDWDCDFLVCSGYKFCGPHVAFVYGKYDLLNNLTPYKLEPAADVVPSKFETGTQPFELLAGLAASIHYLADLGAGETLRQKLSDAYEKIAMHELTLSRYFLGKIQQYKNVHLWGVKTPDDVAQRTPTFALRLDGVSPDDVIKITTAENISAQYHDNFYALGLQRQLGVDGFFRAGCLHYNTTEDLDRLFSVLNRVLSRC